MKTPLILTAEAAKLLNVTPATVRALNTRGVLPAVRAGNTRLFERADVERIAAERAAARKRDRIGRFAA